MLNTPSYNSAGALTPSQVAIIQNAASQGLISRVLLGKVSGVNMNVTTDQSIIINSSNYIIRSIVVTNASTSLTLAVGGVYTAAGKVTAVVSSAQAYSLLTSSTKTLDLTLNALGLSDRRTETTLYLSLTTAQGTSSTVDIYIFGDKLD